jgi:hypothetical protein
MFSETLQSRFISICTREREVSTSQHECEGLLKCLDSNELSSTSIAVYRQAAELLQKSFDYQVFAYPHRAVFAAVQDWLVGISTEYIFNALSNDVPRH